MNKKHKFKLIFMHTAEKVKVDSSGKFYTDGTYNQKVWDRYLSLGCKVVFLARADDVRYTDQKIRNCFNIIDPQIEVVLIKDRLSKITPYMDLSTKWFNDRLIEKTVRDADKLIVRMPCNEGYVAARYSKQFSVPYLVECVGSAWDSLWYYSLKGKLLAPFKDYEMKAVAHGADYVLYVTKSYLQDKYPACSVQVGCSDVQISERDLNIKTINNKKITIGTIGAVDVKYKGQQDVIFAIPKLVASGYDVRYELVGGGDSQTLSDLAESLGVKDRVMFKGMIPHSKVLDWLRDDVHIYAQPSHTEALPRALVEAMSVSCACVGSRVGGIPELLSENMLFSPKKPKQIKNVIVDLLDEPGEFSKQSRRNYEHAENYIVPKLEKTRNEFYESFIALSSKDCHGNEE